MFHSGPSGECPSLDWDVSSDGQRLRGFIAWGEEGKSFARINGTLAGTEFKLTATEVAGSRIADITGRVEADKTLLVTITGTGGPCDGKTIKVPWFSAAAVGGGG